MRAHLFLTRGIVLIDLLLEVGDFYSGVPIDFLQVYLTDLDEKFKGTVPIAKFDAPVRKVSVLVAHCRLADRNLIL